MSEALVSSANRRTPVAVAGATGVVGQRLVRMLEDHPFFELREVAASRRRAGRRYGSEAPWALPGDVPRFARELVLQSVDAPLKSRVVLSALPGAQARLHEERWAGEGRLVSTNASAFRMAQEVPLIVPEVNHETVDLVRDQPWPGGLVANPNCNVAGLAVALAPLQQAFGIAEGVVSTMQAISGAGIGGVDAGAIQGNVLPWISGEEEKIASELGKVLGHDPLIAAASSRVPVADGHLAHVFLRFEGEPSLDEAREALSAFRRPERLKGLPSLPERPLALHAREDRPQPRLDLMRGAGMTVSVGRLRRTPNGGLAFVVLSHNGVRGAAGACLANAELCLARGLPE